MGSSGSGVYVGIPGQVDSHILACLISVLPWNAHNKCGTVHEQYHLHPYILSLKSTLSYHKIAQIRSTFAMSIPFIPHIRFCLRN
jgi:hypothetical protein